MRVVAEMRARELAHTRPRSSSTAARTKKRGDNEETTRSIAGTETRHERYNNAGGSGGVSCPSSCGSFSLSPFGRRAWIRLLSRPRRAIRQGNSAAERPNPSSVHCPNRDIGVFVLRLRGRAHHGPQRDLIGV